MAMQSGIRLIGLVATTIAVASPALAQEGRFERTLSVSGPVTLEVRTGSGSVTVRRGGADAVQVTGTIRARRRWFGTGDVDAYIRQIEAKPPIVQDGDRIELALSDDEDEIRRRLSISYDVMVPADTDVAAHTGSGRITIEGLERGARAKTGSGSIQVSQVAGHVRANTGSGSITLETVGQGADVSTGSGSIDARNVTSNLTASTGSGRITASLRGHGAVKARTGSGSIEVSGANGAVEVDTASGGIRVDGEPSGDWNIHAASGSIVIDLPNKTGFRLDATTNSGSIDVDHPVTVQGTVNRKRLQGTVRGGGSLVALSTSSGSISVR